LKTALRAKILLTSSAILSLILRIKENYLNFLLNSDPHDVIA